MEKMNWILFHLFFWISLVLYDDIPWILVSHWKRISRKILFVLKFYLYLTISLTFVKFLFLSIKNRLFKGRKLLWPRKVLQEKDKYLMVVPSCLTLNCIFGSFNIHVLFLFLYFNVHYFIFTRYMKVLIFPSGQIALTLQSKLYLCIGKKTLFAWQHRN